MSDSIRTQPPAADPAVVDPTDGRGPRPVGLLGGMSWESTALYYSLINEGVRERLGGLHSARLLIHSVDFAQVEHLQAIGDWTAAGDLLAQAAAGLERIGAQAIAVATNTMHKVAPQIEAAIGIPLLHIGDATADAVLGAGGSRVGLLATAYTMEQAFYRERMAARGVEVIVPGDADRALVHRVIYDELCVGAVNPQSRERFTEVIGRLVGAGAEGIVLGCTEVELLVSADDAPVPVFASSTLHARAIVDFALS